MTMTFFSPIEPAASLPYRPNSGCSNCRLRGACLPRRLSDPEVVSLNRCIDTRVRLEKHEVLFTQHDTHDAIFAVRSGSLKTQWTAPNRATQVTGIHIPGDLLGFSGLFESRHGMTATALESTEVCVIRLNALDALTPQFPQIQSHIRGFMSSEMVRLQKLLTQTRLRSEQRIAIFFLDMAKRYAALGYSAERFSLRMTFSDIASLLGMTLATVSRLITVLRRDDVIAIEAKQIEILDNAALEAIASGMDEAPCLAS
nr:helix-turn-helix domain-containing protein [Achromobacter ruhlandii]